MSAPPTGNVLMVCWVLNEPDNAEHVAEIVAAIEAQRDIPGVLTIRSGGREQRVDWAGPDAGFDHAMVLTFDDFDSVRAYPPHPIHQELVATIERLGSNIRGFWIGR